MAKRIEKEEACPKAHPTEETNMIKVTDEFGKVHFVPTTEANRDYRAVLEHRRQREREGR